MPGRWRRGDAISERRRSSRPESTKTQCTATSELISWVTWCASAGAGLARDGHDDVRGPGAVDQLVEAIDAAQDRDGIGLGMEGQMAAPRPQARGSGMTGVDEADDRQPAPRASCPGGGSSRRASRRAPTSTTRLRGVAADRVDAMPRHIRVLFMNRHRSLGQTSTTLATAEPRGSAPTVFDPGTSPSLADLARFGFPSSSSIDRTDVKFELFRK